jgi:5'-nucleotidase
MTKRILVDMDSILADILTPWCHYLNEVHGESMTIDKVVSWNMHENAPKAGLQAYDILKVEGFFRNLHVIPGAVEGVKSFVDAGHDVFVVTAAETPTSFKEKAEWFHEHFPFLGKRRLVLMHEKHLLSGDVLIDDGPHNAEAYRAAHPKAYIASLWYPYHLAAVTAPYDLLIGNGSPNRWSDMATVILMNLARG